MTEEVHYIKATHPEMRKLGEALEYISDHIVDAKTKEFILSLKRYFKKKGHLTIKQFEALIRIHKQLNIRSGSLLG